MEGGVYCLVSFSLFLFDCLNMPMYECCLFGHASEMGKFMGENVESLTGCQEDKIATVAVKKTRGFTEVVFPCFGKGFEVMVVIFQDVSVAQKTERPCVKSKK